MDKIFKAFDPKGTGCLQTDRLFFLYLTMVYCQPNPSFKVERSTFLRDINSSFHYFLEKIGCFQGRVIKYFFI